VAKGDYSRLVRGLDHLDERHATVIRMRFGLGSGSPKTLELVGDHLGLTRERGRQLQKHALADLMKQVGETPPVRDGMKRR
jgi:RNA polymerase primary sigma factor